MMTPGPPDPPRDRPPDGGRGADLRMGSNVDEVTNVQKRNREKPIKTAYRKEKKHARL